MLGFLLETLKTPSRRAQAGGLPPLLELMASRNGNLQHNAAFALYGLADNEDNIAAIVRDGGVQCLQDCELLVQVRFGTPGHEFLCPARRLAWRGCCTWCSGARPVPSEGPWPGAGAHGSPLRGTPSLPAWACASWRYTPPVR